MLRNSLQNAGVEISMRTSLFPSDSPFSSFFTGPSIEDSFFPPSSIAAAFFGAAMSGEPGRLHHQPREEGVSALEQMMILRAIQLSMNNSNEGGGSAPLPKHVALPKIHLRTEADARRFKDACSICLEEAKVGEDWCVLKCQHAFHHHCATSWMSRHASCCMCRAEHPSIIPESPSSSTRTTNSSPLLAAPPRRPVEAPPRRNSTQSSSFNRPINDDDDDGDVNHPAFSHEHPINVQRRQARAAASLRGGSTSTSVAMPSFPSMSDRESRAARLRRLMQEESNDNDDTNHAASAAAVPPPRIYVPSASAASTASAASVVARQPTPNHRVSLGAHPPSRISASSATTDLERIGLSSSASAVSLPHAAAAAATATTSTSSQPPYRSNLQLTRLSAQQPASQPSAAQQRAASSSVSTSSYFAHINGATSPVASSSSHLPPAVPRQHTMPVIANNSNRTPSAAATNRLSLATPIGRSRLGGNATTTTTASPTLARSSTNGVAPPTTMSAAATPGTRSTFSSRVRSNNNIASLNRR